VVVENPQGSRVLLVARDLLLVCRDDLSGVDLLDVDLGSDSLGKIGVVDEGEGSVDGVVEVEDDLSSVVWDDDGGVSLSR